MCAQSYEVDWYYFNILAGHFQTEKKEQNTCIIIEE